MPDSSAEVLFPEADETIAALRRAGARFAFLHGSRAAGTHRPDSDYDVAAWFGTEPPPVPWEVAADLPAGIDLLVLDEAPLRLAGRIALDGILLFDDDPPARVAWQADTRLMYFDEEPLMQQMDRLFMEAVLRG